MSVHVLRAPVGFLLLVPTATLVVSGLLDLEPPAVVIQPVVLIGGLMAAMIANLASTVIMSAKRRDGALLGGIAIQVEGRGLHLAVLLIGELLVGAIAVYPFFENFGPRQA
jgi:hypothetical protein